MISDPVAVRQVLGRPEDFLPTNALTAVVPLSPGALRTLREAEFALPPVLASAAGQLHAQVRRVVAGFFTPAAIAAIAPTVIQLTEQRAKQVNVLLNAGPVDLAEEIAHRIPLTIMQQLIGIECPESLKKWSQDSLELFWGWPDSDRQLELAVSAAAFYTWLRNQVEADQDPRSLFGALAAAGLTTQQICSLGYFLLIASHETTAQLITTGLYRALQQQEQWKSLASGGAALAFVRRLLARESAVSTWRRIAASDTYIGDHHVRVGTEILLELTGHHRADPGETAYRLAFGYGIHRCLGAKLAELETTLVIETTARHLDPVVLADPTPDWLRLLSFQAPQAVIVQRNVQ